MSFRQIRHFVAVAEELHFGRAAKRLNMAQPPLSQSIRRLEADLGVELLARSRKGVELTAAGEIFLREARQALIHADLARKLALREAQKAQEVRVGFIGPALYRLLPPLLVAFTRDNPAIDVRLYEERTPALVKAIVQGETDVGFVTAGSQEIEDCDTLIVERATIVAAIPADWPIVSRASLTLAELADYPLILPPAQNHATEPRQVLKMFGSAGGRLPNVIQESTHSNTTLSLVGAGVGFSIITGTARLANPANVRFVPLTDHMPSSDWALTMIWRDAQLTRAGRRFVDFTRNYVADRPELMSFAIP
ncbi:LysR family transcriptional regulator [Novosphingobium sp. G106]|uniref:LysR substrate-binding domain-containing protein n=1 Tax=Novosphingobium sp. G106 TaxID=2849500 RepID=UPI001C2DC015|nr:LysR substrate-binding domain-containing protein [Novosphingobium sp. G106]MBV1691564.1 LysR family transcriptional regulator [Novosphingobium sp. G106]